MDIFGIRVLLICALIFVPFEHLFAERSQKIFRKGLVVDLNNSIMWAAGS